MSKAIKLIIMLAAMLLNGTALQASPVTADSLLRLEAHGVTSEELTAALATARFQSPTRGSTWDLFALRWQATGIHPQGTLALQELYHKTWPDSKFLLWADWYALQARIRLGQLRSAILEGLEILAGEPVEELAERVRTQILSLLALNHPDLAGSAWLPPLDFKRQQIWDSLRSQRGLKHRIGLVLPLRGLDGSQGRALRSGVMQLLTLHPEAEHWEIVIRDCESDPLLARRQCKELDSLGVDVMIVPGDSRYAAAAADTGPTPVVFPWVENSALLDSDPQFFQCNTLPEDRLQTLFRLAADSLHIERMITLTPADREGKELEQRIQELALERGIELGQPQWYLPGVRDLRRQAENMSIFASSFDSTDAMLVLCRAADMGVLIPQLAGTGPAGWVLGDAAFLEGLRLREMASFRDSLVLATDWLPSSSFPLWREYLESLRDKEGRQPDRLETLGFESLRLMLECGALSQSSGRSFEASLRSLDLPSAFGGRFRMKNRANATTAPVVWDGIRYRSYRSSK